jgi:RNA polymerase sigma factor (sigma-70 family)
MHRDEKLLFAYRDGQAWAYETLYREYGELVQRFLRSGFTFVSRGRTCRYRGGATDIDVDSVVQETFARAFAVRTRQNYDGERPFRNYLFSIAKNLVLREYQRRERVLQGDNAEETTDILARRGLELGLTSAHQDPERSVADDELRAVTRAFIVELNEEERDFFSVRFAKGLTQQGAAAELGVTRARVKLLEKSLRRRFLEMLRTNGYFVGYTPKPRWSRQTQAA